MPFTQIIQEDSPTPLADGRPDPALLALEGDFLRLVAEHNPDVTGVVDPDGTCLFIAGNVFGLLGFDASEFIGLKVWDFVHPDDLEFAAGALNEAARVAGQHLPTVFRVQHRSESWVECEVKGSTFDGPGGAWMVLSVRGTRDRDQVMDRRGAIEQLVRSASTECSAVSWEGVDEVVSKFLGQLAGVVNARSVALAWEHNGALETVACWPDVKRCISGVPFEPLWPLDQTVDRILSFSSDLESEPESAIRNSLISWGAKAVVEVTLSAQHPWRVMRLTFDENWQKWDDANIDLVNVLTSTLLSTLSRCWAERSLKVQASTDALTGLMNRTELYRVLELCLEDRRGNGNVAVLYADLNYFKQVNDLHGHSAGDKLLVEVSEALKSSVRAVDVLARVGGDEFVIVCPDIEDSEQLDGIIKRVEESVAALSSPERPVAISVGRAISNSDSTGDQLMDEADEDMYRVKRARFSTSRSATPQL